MADQKILLVCYSRSGTTLQVGQDIAGLLECDLEEIVDRKDRSGPMGWFGAARDAGLRKGAEIEPSRHSPADFNLLIIGTPVWAFSMSCPVRAYLERHRAELPEVAFFLTTGSSGIQSTFGAMQEICGKEPRAVLGLKTGQVRKGKHAEAVQAFVDSLK
jgi:flavodoxin